MTSAAAPRRTGYVLKMFPRFSETFIVNEILAHEAAGMAIEIFSLRAPIDERVHESVAQVRSPVSYLPGTESGLSKFWAGVQDAAGRFPGLWRVLESAGDEEARDVHQALLLACAAQDAGVTHLHAHFGTAAATVARLAARIAGLPYSFTAHAKDIFHESVSHQDLERKLRDAAAVVTVSDFNVKYLRGSYGASAGKVRRVYNGLDLDAFDYSPPVDRPPRIVCVGRLIEKKGIADLVAACELLLRRGREFDCAIIGSGPLEDDLRAQIARLGLESRVALLGPRTQDEVKRLVQGAAVFAAPCVVGADGNRDGLPTVLLEAMALGTPCVATDVTGIPEVLRDGQTGLMVPQHDPQALALAIERLLDAPELRARLADNARRLMQAEFDIHRNTRAMRELLELAVP